MIGDVSRAERIYIVCGYTDMRKAIDGLAAIVQQNFRLDVFSGSLFLFCSKRCDRIKALLWEEDGFVLLYKRLENGKYKWPRDSDEAKQITQQEFRWLMDNVIKLRKSSKGSRSMIGRRKQTPDRIYQNMLASSNHTPTLFITFSLA